MTEERSDRFTTLEEHYAGYEVYDQQGEKIGRVDDLFVDENDQPEYIGVKTGLFGLKSTLIPWELLRVDEERRIIEVSESKDRVKDAPNFDDDQDITPEYEDRVYKHFGLGRRGESGERGGYGPYYSDSTSETRPDAASSMSPGYREREGSQGSGSEEEYSSRSEARRPDEDTEDRYTEKARERQSETATDTEDRHTEEARERQSEAATDAGSEGATADTGAEEREPGGQRVRKRVRTDREQVRVPVKREEARVEQGPDGELHIRKEVIEDEQTIEVDVNREEVDLEDEGETGQR